MNIVIFGAPGSGKGTQSEMLIEHYGLHHISTGEVLRRHIAQGSELGKVADSFISQGMLIPDELMIEVLEDIFKNDSSALEKGVIFDGFPRTVPQAEALSKLLKDYNTEIHAVVGLEVAEDELIRRMIERGKQSGRSDDNLSTIRKRLEVYHSQTAPLKEYYCKKGCYHAVNGNGSVEEIFGHIGKALEPFKLIK
ncbi:MAG: adenylate kinase [Muribaculaceae bacterium]|nr:adenylate kinase [Muribaculaceae bacterium]